MLDTKSRIDYDDPVFLSATPSSNNQILNNQILLLALELFAVGWLVDEICHAKQTCHSA